MPDTYEQTYQKSLEDPESFWGEIALESYWFKKWDTVLSNGRPPFYRWFAGGMVNTCYNALDFHIDRGRGRKVALIYDSPVTGTIVKYTYSQLRDLVAKFAGVLVTQGVKKGDRVVIYMPMIPEAAIAMLACARIGAIHSVVFGGFAAKELATRIDDARPKVIVSASCGIEGSRTIAYKPLLDKAIDLAGHKPCRCIIYQRPMEKAALTAGRDLDWKTAMKDADPIGCVPVAATDPLYILYTSGTTGQPKGVVRDNGGHIVALKWSMKAIYDIDEDDVWWAASDVGWVVGHSILSMPRCSKVAPPFYSKANQWALPMPASSGG
jgi:propionyl-CoA synthetase